MTKKQKINARKLRAHLKEGHADWASLAGDMSAELTEQYHVADHVRCGADKHHEHEEHKAKEKQHKTESDQLELAVDDEALL